MTGTYPGFEGTVGRTFAGSEGAWPARPTPPPGAPNVIVMLADDLGFADLGCYGSEIDTPHLDALAARGIRCTNFHTAPMCSPTRAVAAHRARAAPRRLRHASRTSTRASPATRWSSAADAATIAEILRDQAGYATMMVGKWHLAKDSDCSAAGPQHSWPCQRGFDRFYGILDAFTNLHHPHRLVEDNHLVEVDRYPDDYYFTDDLTDRAISMIRETQGEQPRAAVLPATSPTARCTRRCTPGPRTSRSTAAATTAAGTSCGPSGSPASSELGRRPRGPGAPAPQHRAEPRRPGRGTTSTSASSALFARAHGGLRGDGRPHRPERRPARRRARGDGRARQHDHRLPLRQRRVTRGRGHRHDGVLRAPAAGRRHRRRLRAPRRHRRAADHAALPARAGRWRRARRSGSTRSTRTRAATRCRSASRGRPGSPSAARSAASTRTSPTCCRRCWSSSASSGRQTRNGVALAPLDGVSFAAALRDPDAPSTHHETGVGVLRPPRALPRRLGAGDAAPAAHAVRRRASGSSTTSPPTRPSCATSPRTSPSGSRRWRPAWEELAWANQIYPLDEGSSIKYLRPARAQRGLRRAGDDPAGHADARALALGPADLVPVGHHPRSTCDHRSADQGMLVAHGDQGVGLRALRPRRRAALRAQQRARRDARRSRAVPMADGVQRGRRRAARDRRPAVGAHALGRRRGAGDAGRRPDAVRHRAVRGHRRRHRPALARCRGRSTSASARSRTPARSTRSRTRRASRRRTRPASLMDMLREMGAAFE